MFYYINQPRTPSFPIGLVTTESNFLVRSVETGLGRLTLVVSVISVHVYPFCLSQTWPVTLRIKELVFSGCNLPPDSNETKLGSRTKRLLHQQVKIPVQFWCHIVHGSVPVELFPTVWIFLRSLGAICYDRWIFSENHIYYFKDWCLMNSQPTFLFLTYF